MNELNNMIIWFNLDENGDVQNISRINAIDPNLDLDKHFAKWSLKSEHRQANVYTFTREQITVPDHIMAGTVTGVALIMHYHDKKHMAILPYFVMIGEMSNDLEGTNVLGTR